MIVEVKSCCYCGFVSTKGRFIQMIDKRWRCASGAQCSKRLKKQHREQSKVSSPRR